MPVRIGIIDYGMGNLKSVYKALRFLKTNPIFINKEEGFDCDGFVLPGVGAFEDGMRNLTPFIKVLKKEVETKPILGICLGMQIFSLIARKWIFKGLNLSGSVRNNLKFLMDGCVRCYTPFCNLFPWRNRAGIKFPNSCKRIYIVHNFILKRVRIRIKTT